MPRIAKLPTGEELHFPDDTPDQVMDDTVMRHMGKNAPEEEPPAPDPLSEIVPILANMVEVLSGDREGLLEKTDDLAIAMQQMETASVKITTDTMKSVGGVVSGNVLRGLAALAEKISELSGKLDGIKVLTESVQQLSGTIETSAKRLEDTLLLPNYVRRDKAGEIEVVGKKVLE